MRKRMYWVRMEAIGFTDFKVLASNKEDARQLAQQNSHLATCHCDGFEPGEVSTVPLSAFDDPEIKPTEENPVIEVT